MGDMGAVGWLVAMVPAIMNQVRCSATFLRPLRPAADGAYLQEEFFHRAKATTSLDEDGERGTDAQRRGRRNRVK